MVVTVTFSSSFFSLSFTVTFRFRFRCERTCAHTHAYHCLRSTAVTPPLVAVLLGDELRTFDHFLRRADEGLFANSQPFDVFLSTAPGPLRCAKSQGFLSRSDVRWFGETPDPDRNVRAALGLVDPNVTVRHLLQWWRLRDAWTAMEHHEKHRGSAYDSVVRLRTDLRMPPGLDLARAWLKVTDERALAMRGDWIFWGKRETMRLALVDFVDDALPRLHAIGQRGYFPLPWRHLLAVGADGLSAGLLTWLKFPKKTGRLPFGFTAATVSSTATILNHTRTHIDKLEAAEWRGAFAHLKASHLISGRDRWWKWYKSPDSEKAFFYHSLNRSLLPQSAVDIINQGLVLAKRQTIHGHTNGLLLPEWIRHHPNCTCVCNVTLMRDAKEVERWHREVGSTAG